MSQKSYGTITIVDTNDIARIYVVYAKSATNTDAPSAAASTWTESIANAPGSGDYIWQRTVTEQSGTHDLTYGNPVCVTGPQGGTGATGRGVSSIVTTYCNYGEGTPAASYAGWQNTVPTYDSSKPNYWVKTVITYTTGSPATDTSIYKDNGITDAIYNSAVANSIAQDANEKSQGALSQAIETQYQTEALDAKLKYFFWPGDNNYPGVYAVSGIDGTTFNEGSISTYGYNVAIKPASISIGYNSIKAILIDGSNPSLKFYTPSKTTQASNPSMELSSTALVFNNPTTGQAQLTLSASGSLQSGNYSRGNDTKFAASGTKIDLTAGDIITQYFRLSQGGEVGGPNAGAYIYGTIEAIDGAIGSNNTNYWEIGNYTDYNLQNSAEMIGHGSSFIQLGDSSTWRLATNRIHTGWYISTDSYLHFPEFTNGSETRRWDYGIHVPTSKGDKFLYIRNASSTTALSNLVADLEDTNTTHYWTYKFYIDGEGNLTTTGNITLTGRDSTTGIIDAHDVRIDGVSIAGGSLIAGSLSSYGGSSKRPVYFPDDGEYQGKPLQIDVTDNTSATAVASDDDKLITARTLYYAGYVKSSGITSVTIAATSPVVSSTSSEQTGSSASTTISLSNGYGDIKNPYGTKTKNYVLAGPTTGSAAAPTFRALVAADIPDLSSIYLTSYTETDPTVPGWAKASTKPSYGLTEISGTDDLRAIEALTGTSGFLKKTAANTWSLDTTTYLTSSSTLDASKLSGAIPSAVTATTQASTDNSTKIATTAYVTTAIANLPEPMIFKGSVGTSGTVTWANLATAVAANEGWTYKVITAHTAETGKPAAKVGDTIISNGSEWIVIPSGDEPSGTVTSIATGDGLTGGPITSTGTISHADTSSQSSITASSRRYITAVTLDDFGHVTGLSTGTETVTDTHHIANLVNGSAASGTNATSNKAVTSGSVYLNLIEGASGSQSIRNSHKLIGGNGLSITSNTDGDITFTSPDAFIGVSFDETTGTISFTKSGGGNPATITTDDFVITQATGATGLVDASTNVGLTVNGPVGFANGVPVTMRPSTSAGQFLKDDGTWATPAGTYSLSVATSGALGGIKIGYSESGTNYAVKISSEKAYVTVPWTDTQVTLAAVTSGNTYYPVVGSGAGTATRQIDTTGLVYKGTNGTTSAVGSAILTLGNSTASGTANNKQGQLILYGSNTKKATITLAAPSADIAIALPTSGGTLALTNQIPTVPSSTASATTGITASTTATKTTLGTAFTIPNVTSVGSASTWAFEDVTCDDITAWSAGSFTRGTFSGGSGSFSATVSNHVLSFSHSHTAASHAADSFTAPSLSYTAKTASHVKSGGNGTAPSLGTAFTVPNVTGNTSATVSITDNGHTHSI